MRLFRPTNRDPRRGIVIVGFGFVAAVVVLKLSTGFSPSNGWGAVVYGVVGVLVTLWVAHVAHGIQEEIRNFLMGKVNSRHERTDAVIAMCEEADSVFCAATFFPAVGIRDNPETKPSEYLIALEKALERDVNVSLVSVSFAEARQYCTKKRFPAPSLKALDWIEKRLSELEGRFPDALSRREIAGNLMTTNVCFNDSSALLYHMSLVSDDDGAGFKSSDARILAVAEGGFSRYEEVPVSTPQRQAHTGRVSWMRSAWWQRASQRG